MADSKIDIRIIQLAKWQVPKSESVLKFGDNPAYISIGYFDLLHVEKVDTSSQEAHPLLQAYRASHRYQMKNERNNGNISANYSVQEMIAFTNQSEDLFTPDQIEDFWKDESLLVFVSLIHIDNDSDIKKIIDKIKQTFKERTYLIYFSFDYSGIILFAKGMGFKTYLELIFQLNYNHTEGKKLIRDTYSLYGMNKVILKKYFRNLSKGKKVKSLPGGEETFSASVNIGIQNYETYKEFVGEIEKEYPGTIVEYGLFGRHDVSIVNNNANLSWLIYIQYLLDKFTQKHEGQTTGDLFSTYETFMKIPEISGFKDADPEDEDSLYYAAERKLRNICEKYFRILLRHEVILNGEYQIPVQAVYYSILSILKNRFAEDFVCCMYESFCAFLEYLTEKMSSPEVSSEEFDNCYSSYFRALSSLVNSAMHSERQFIQATAFNAIIYDVPPKIMAFYAAVINDIQKIIRSDQDRKYTFLLTPSFHNEIAVQIISYKERPPHDRLLMVSINEQSLYNPKALIKRMAHEIAHFVGDGLRERESRKECIVQSMVRFALTQLLYERFYHMDGFDVLVEGIIKTLLKDVKLSDEGKNYSEDLPDIRDRLAEEFEKNEEIERLIREFVLKSLLKCYIESEKDEHLEDQEDIKKYILHIACHSLGTDENVIRRFFQNGKLSYVQIEILVNLIMADISQEVVLLNRDEELLIQNGTVIQSSVAALRKDKQRIYLGEYTEWLISGCSEAFSDIQMVLLMGMEYEEYLRSFLVDEKIDLEKLPYLPEDLIRFTVVALTLNCVGIWKGIDRKIISEDEHSAIQQFHRNIIFQINAVKNNITEQEYQELAEDRKEGEKYWKNLKGEKGQEVTQLSENEGNISHRYYYANYYLTKYLIKCAKDSIKHYGDAAKLQKIKELRKTVDSVVKCENIMEVFTFVCKEITEYKKELFQ